jgi:hypothetical protein
MGTKQRTRGRYSLRFRKTPSRRQQRVLASTVSSRIAKSINSRAKQRKSKLRRLGVTDFAPIVNHRTYTESYLSADNVCIFGSVASPNAGLNSKNALDDIFAENATLTGDADHTVVMSYQRCDYFMKNQTDIPIYVTAYECQMRRDWNSGYGSFESEVFAEGFNTVGLANSANQQIGVSLFENTKFTHWVKISKQKTFVMQPAVARKYSMVDSNIYKRNFKYKDEATTNVLKGTKWLVLKLHGTPVHSSGTVTQVGISKISLDVVVSRTTKFHIPQHADSHTRSFIDDGLSTLTTPVGAQNSDWTISATVV